MRGKRYFWSLNPGIAVEEGAKTMPGASNWLVGVTGKNHGFDYHGNALNPLI